MKSRYLALKSRELRRLETAEALWYLLKISPYKANLLMQNPPYKVFTVPKKNGSPRTIEDPCNELKTILDRLNDFLQALYFFHKTDAAYGYIIRPDDGIETRNVLTHAQKHCASPYLLNIDVLDFFHYVHWQTLYESLTRMPFHLHETIARNICNLCTFNGRLPMGAPTSPALSNIATYLFDLEMQQYCKGEGILYTRYVDDMSFSSHLPITERHFEQLAAMINRYGYILNPKKIKWFLPTDKKIITGLVVKDGVVSVPPEYSLEIAKEINILKAYVLTQTRLFPGNTIDYFYCKPAQKIKGALAFVESVHGSDDPNLIRLQQQLGEAIQPPAEYESLNWLEIGYTFF